MRRPFWKPDDGLVDLIIKGVSIFAFLIAAHQYYFKIYPVWSKEKELSDATVKLEQLESDTVDLDKKNSELRRQETELTLEIQKLEQKEETLTTAYDNKIKNLQEQLEEERESFILKNAELEKGLYKAESSSQQIKIEAVTAHLQRYSTILFQIQLDNIRSLGEPISLDLKRDALQFYAETITKIDSNYEKAALEILKEYTMDEIKEGESTYSRIMSAYIMFMHKPYGKKIIRDLH